MEDDANQSPSNMVPVALAVLGIVLGGAGLYFGLTANQRLNPIDESVSAGATSSAKIETVINEFQTQVAELAALDGHRHHPVEGVLGGEHACLAWCHRVRTPSAHLVADAAPQALLRIDDGPVRAQPLALVVDDRDGVGRACNIHASNGTKYVYDARAALAGFDDGNGAADCNTQRADD